jgi:hypothetical protein
MYPPTSDTGTQAATGTQSVVRTGTVLAVGVIAALQSYSHIYDLARTHGQDHLNAVLLPLSVDGLIIAASLALATAPRLARWMLGIGVAATVAANVAYGLPQGALAALVSAWPGISFVGAAELLLRGRASRVSGDAVGESQTTAPGVPAQPDSDVLQPGPDVPPDTDRDTRADPPDTPRGTQRPKTVPASRDLSVVFAADLAAGRVPGIRTIRSRMHCGQPTAYTVQGQLRQLAATA